MSWTTSFAVRRNVALLGEYCPMPIHLHIYEIDYIDYTEFVHNLFLCRLTKVTKLICYLKKDQATQNCNPCWTLSCELCTTEFTRRPDLNTQMKELHDIIIKACMY